MAPDGSPGFQPFVIALFDDIDPKGATVLYGDDPGLWEWLTRAESFLPGSEFVELPIPGTDERAHVTIWAPSTDKAQHLTRLPGTRRPHPSLIELELGRTDEFEFHAKYARLLRAIPSERVFESRW